METLSMLCYLVQSAIVLIVLYNVITWLLQSRKITSYKNKAVFITGCDIGFGRLTAIELAKLGFTVFAGCLKEESIRSIEDEKDGLKGQIIGVKCDVTSDEEAKKATDFIKDNLKDKELWAIINNAGIFTSYGPAEWCDAEIYQKSMEVNFFGAVRVTNPLIPLLRESHGRIMVAASVAARCGTIFGSPYSTAKAAVNSWAEAMAFEYSTFSIKVGVLEPGVFTTNIIDREAKRRRVEFAWNRLDNSVKGVYGPRYVEELLSWWHKFIADQSCSDISLVIDSYVHFVTAEHPKFRYQPGFFSKWVWGKVSLLPTNWLLNIFPFVSDPIPIPAYVDKQKSL
uniref:Estradiol 17-beta-dehydrogenase 2 n=1 Tax=Bursaphelenchus xylophilus TaxID=6326 RepID=A0A1I7SUT1_BURXY